MAVNLEDERLTSINEEKQNALNSINNTYDTMINDSQSYYDKLIQSQEDYKNQQSELQQQQSDLAIEQINQAQANQEKDYIKEQKGAYADYMKQQASTNQQMLNSGQANSGYSASIEASYYNQYQSRVATARESYNQITTEYEMSKKDAMLQNSSALMEIAYNTQQQQLQLMLDSFQYKNNLLLQQIAAQNETEDRYTSKWNTMLNQINTENELAEKQRQYDESMAYQKERDAVSDTQWEKSYQLSKQSLSSGSGGYYTDNTQQETQTTNDWTKELGNTKVNPGNTSDYYFNNTQNQPRYIGNTKLKQYQSHTAGDYNLQSLGIPSSNKIWTTGDGNYFVWVDKENGYYNCTKEVEKYYQAQTSSNYKGSTSKTTNNNTSVGSSLITKNENTYNSIATGQITRK